MKRPSAAGGLKVLESFRPNSMTNPYLLLLADALRERVEVATFSWRTALRGDYDVFHLHWPEVLVRGRTASRTTLRTMAFVAILVTGRLRKRPIVRTLHNVVPHESLNAVHRLVLRLCDRWTSEWITLTETTSSPAWQPSTTILHGHYRDWYPDASDVQIDPGRVLFFGLIRAYKGIEELITATNDIERQDVTVRIVGRLDDDELGTIIENASATDPRISALLAYLDETALAREIAECRLVVLPYRHMINSGSALLALSLGRPVLLPRSLSTEELASEVGPRWVTLYDGELTAETLCSTLEGAMSGGDERPDLSAREWTAIADAHVDVFRRAQAESADR